MKTQQLRFVIDKYWTAMQDEVDELVFYYNNYGNELEEYVCNRNIPDNKNDFIIHDELDLLEMIEVIDEKDLETTQSVFIEIKHVVEVRIA